MALMDQFFAQNHLAVREYNIEVQRPLYNQEALQEAGKEEFVYVRFLYTSCVYVYVLCPYENSERPFTGPTYR